MITTNTSAATPSGFWHDCIAHGFIYLRSTEACAVLQCLVLIMKMTINHYISMHNKSKVHFSICATDS